MYYHLKMVEKYGGKVPGAFNLSPFMEGLIEIIYWVIPNLEHFNIKGPVVHGMLIPGGHILWVTAYAVMFILIFLGITSLWFSKRDFV